MQFENQKYFENIYPSTLKSRNIQIRKVISLYFEEQKSPLKISKTLRMTREKVSKIIRKEKNYSNYFEKIKSYHL